MAHSITYKMPRARKESKFVVYPFAEGATTIKLQSDNHCIIVFLADNRALVSPRFNQYPRFEACSPDNGGKAIALPQEIAEQLETIIENPTGNVTTLVG